MKCKHWSFSTLAACVLLTLNPSALAAPLPVLGTAQNFAVLGGAAVTNTGATTLTGDLGVSPGSSITGSGSITLNGTQHTTDAVALQAQNDVNTAYNALAGLAPTANLTGQDLGGMTLIPGVYFFATSAQLTGTLTLDAQGANNACWVFQIGSTLTTASASSVLTTNFGSNKGSDAGLFWQVGSSATLGTTTEFEGNILAMASITLNTAATIENGRALAKVGAVTLDTNTISSLCPNNLDSNGKPGLGFSGGLGFDTSGKLVPISQSGPGLVVPLPSASLLGGGGLAFLFISRFLSNRLSGSGDQKICS